MTITTAGQAQGGLPGQRIAQEKAQSQGTVIHVSTAGTREVQQALNKAGYSVGNVDGKWNKQTQEAARNFQQANGLEPTGTLTLRTIIALGLQDILQPRVASKPGQAQGRQPGQRLAQEAAVGEGTPLYISPAGVREIQQALNKAGYSVGNVDGQWDKETQAAARNFQQAQGLEPNGQLDIALISKLGLEQQIFRPQIARGGGQGGQGAQGRGAVGQASGGMPGQRLAQERAVGEGTPLYASPASVRQITQVLNKAGYSAGDVDGRWDDQTSKAAANFQQANGLEPTGTLTTELLAAAGMSNWMQGQGSPTIGQRGGQQGGGQAAGQQGQRGGATGTTPPGVLSPRSGGGGGGGQGQQQR